MDQEPKFPARVAAVVGSPLSPLQPERIVMNRGSVHGVKTGQTFLIYALGELIKDPSTGEVLGQLEVVKAQAKAIHVQDKMTTLELLGSSALFTLVVPAVGDYVKPI